MPNYPGANITQFYPVCIGIAGMVGESLNATGDYSVVVSLDAGVTWRKTNLRGDYTINILDQGAALVAIYRSVGIDGINQLR